MKKKSILWIILLIILIHSIQRIIIFIRIKSFNKQAIERNVQESMEQKVKINGTISYSIWKNLSLLYDFYNELNEFIDGELQKHPKNTSNWQKVLFKRFE